MSQLDRQNYNNVMELVQSAGPLSNKDFAEITFINLSDTVTAVLNNVFPIAPGASIAFNGNVGERDTTRYSISFTGGTVGELYVMMKVYQS